MDLEIAATDLATGLVRLAAAIDYASRGSSGPGDHTIVEQQLLLMLNQRGPGLTLQDLAGQAGMSRQDTLNVLGALVTKDMVALDPAPSYSPHETLIDLTERGRSYPKLLNWAADLLAELDQLDDEDQRLLLDLVVRRIATLQRENRIPITRMCLTCRFFDPYAHVGRPQPHHCRLVDAPFGNQQLRLRCPEQQPPE
jgi:DNA-binding MarR family transcriptional regulator